MRTLAVVDSSIMDLSVIHRSQEPDSDIEISDLISGLSPTKIESVIALIYGNPDIADATRSVRMMLGEVGDLKKISRNATLMAQLATKANEKHADVVDEKDVEFFSRQANSIQDDLKSILKYLDANTESRGTWLDFQLMHIASAYMEVYGRAFAITEHHRFMLFDLALEYL